MDAVADAYLQTCRACNHEFRAHAKLVGKSVPCPYCQRPIQVVAKEAAEDKLVNQELGGCRLVRRLGAGALGVVYEANQISVNRRVAIKMLSSKAAADKEIVQRFQREANLSARIRHPGVVGVYDCGQDRSVHFLTMEFIDGPTVAGLIEEQGRLKWQEALPLVSQVAQALAHLHAQGIIHRDIKPANILVEKGVNAKLADLGLAKQVDADAGSAGLTMQGVAMGSPAYMPPEQIRNAKDATATADIYALGATFYQMVTGKIPFDGKNGTEVMTKVLKDDPKPVIELAPDVPPGVAALIEWMLAKDATKRPATATDLVAELAEVGQEPDRPRKRGGVARAAGAGPGATTEGSTANWVLGISILVAVVAIVVAVWMRSRR
jgi:serine/threonine protein kinase